jgi:DNA-binding NarL/FixJ family response regulator
MPSPILIVDDSPIIVPRLQQMLEDITPSSPIFHAGDYTQALAILLDSSPAFVFLDINLPGASGIDLLRHLKKGSPSPIVIMLSNQSGDFYRSRCLALGADYFIDKSTEFDLIPEIIRSRLPA